MRRMIASVTLSLAMGGPAVSSAPADEPPFMPKTLGGALTAARNISCYDCVEVVRWGYVDGKQVRLNPARSARRGIVQISAAEDTDGDGEPDSSGAVLTMGYRGQTWDLFYSTSNTDPHVGILPSRTWVCPAGRKPVTIRADRFGTSPVAGRVYSDTPARAHQFRLYRPALISGKVMRPGYGWYKVTVRGTTGWVLSGYVGNSDSCDMLRASRESS